MNVYHAPNKDSSRCSRNMTPSSPFSFVFSSLVLPYLLRVSQGTAQRRAQWSPKCLHFRQQLQAWEILFFLISLRLFLILFYFKNIYIFTWLCQVLVAYTGSFCYSGTQTLQLRHAGLVASQHVGSYFPDQGSNSHPLYCKADSFFFFF